MNFFKYGSKQQYHKVGIFVVAKESCAMLWSAWFSTFARSNRLRIQQVATLCHRATWTSCIGEKQYDTGWIQTATIRCMQGTHRALDRYSTAKTDREREYAKIDNLQHLAAHNALQWALYKASEIERREWLWKQELSVDTYRKILNIALIAEQDLTE